MCPTLFGMGMAQTAPVQPAPEKTDAELAAEAERERMRMGLSTRGLRANFGTLIGRSPGFQVKPTIGGLGDSGIGSSPGFQVRPPNLGSSPGFRVSSKSHMTGF